MKQFTTRILAAAFGLAVGLAAVNAGAADQLLHPHSVVAPGTGEGTRRNSIEPNAGETAIWKRITLGTHTRIQSLRVALDAARVRVGNSADEILGRPAFSLSKTRMDVDLVVASVAELGFHDSAPLADIYWRAGELGLELCPAEVAPLLRLQYVDQPIGEFLNIAMRPIATHGGNLIALSVANAGTGPLLIGGEGRLDMVMNWKARFVFVRPQRIALPSVR